MAFEKVVTKMDQRDTRRRYGGLGGRCLSKCLNATLPEIIYGYSGILPPATAHCQLILHPTPNSGFAPLTPLK